MVDRRSLVPLVAVTVAVLAYFGFCAAWVLDSVSRGTLGAIESELSVRTAVAWGIAEMVAVLVPFVVVAVIVWVRPGFLPRNIWIAPLACVILPITFSAMWNLWAIGSLTPDYYIGGGLAPEAAVPVQLIAGLIGTAIIMVAERLRPAPATATA